MNLSLCDKIIDSLKQASLHNGNTMVKPEVILWPDPDKQWSSIIPVLQKKIDGLLVYGEYDLEQMQGPAIWLKCMIAKLLPEANWSDKQTPIIYLPGISKQDLKNIISAGLELQPLMEYLYNGMTWLHENGKEWTILAFLQNIQSGLGLKVITDNSTKEALISALPVYFEDKDILYKKTVIDSDYLLSLIFPDVIPNIVKWISEGDQFINSLGVEKKETFINICTSKYDFSPDYKNIIEIVFKLGSQKDSWNIVWQYFSNAPSKYPKIIDLLKIAKPAELGKGMFALPEESWPQINEDYEKSLRQELIGLLGLQGKQLKEKLNQLEASHAKRRGWIWNELGQSPLVNSLFHILKMHAACELAYSTSSIEDVQNYYIDKGYQADTHMRLSLAKVNSSEDQGVVTKIIQQIYKPWLENLNIKFQSVVDKEYTVYNSKKNVAFTEDFVLFVDALRFELAKDFCDKLLGLGITSELIPGWTAIPTLTPTAKPYCSPISGLVNTQSEFVEFRPQLNSGKDLQTAAFRDALLATGYTYVSSLKEIESNKKLWMEIGDIDTKGHEEQANMVRRVDELFEQFKETIFTALEKGVKTIRVVTDHGWLLLPGGLPKQELSKDLTETRWGRCALLKEGAKTDLLHLPWQWNQSIYIAYAPGISFFKKNEEYAHGGISVQECLVPYLRIENNHKQEFLGKLKSVKWVNLTCRVETEDAPDGYKIDIRTKANDKDTSVLVEKNMKSLVNGKCSLMADDKYEGSAAHIVLLTNEDVIIDKQTTEIGN